MLSVTTTTSPTVKLTPAQRFERFLERAKRGEVPAHTVVKGENHLRQRLGSQEQFDTLLDEVAANSGAAAGF